VTPGLNVPTDFFRWAVQAGLARFDDVGVRVSIPPGETIPVEYAPPPPPAGKEPEVWLLYYISFGDIPADVFAIVCEHRPTMFWHECRPCGYEVIDPGCIVWCPIRTKQPYMLTIENLDTVNPQTIKCRLWQLRILESIWPEFKQAYDAYITGSRALQDKLDELIEVATETLEAMRVLPLAPPPDPNARRVGLKGW